MQLRLLAAQFHISLNIKENLNQIMAIVDQAEEDELIILPEGSLSGYSDDMGFLSLIDPEELRIALTTIKEQVHLRNVHLIFGSIIKEAGRWYNAAIGYSHSNEDFLYKINLATHERTILTPGDLLPVFALQYQGQTAKVGIQLCREIRYPEQWKYLALKGAQIFIYLTYTLGDQIDVWRSHLISRAAENQRFLVGCNVAAKNQQCSTMLISPRGEVLKEINSANPGMIRTTVDLSEVSNWYLDQSRADVVKII